MRLSLTAQVAHLEAFRTARIGDRSLFSEAVEPGRG